MLTLCREVAKLTPDQCPGATSQPLHIFRGGLDEGRGQGGPEITQGSLLGLVGRDL